MYQLADTEYLPDSQLFITSGIITANDRHQWLQVLWFNRYL